MNHTNLTRVYTRITGGLFLAVLVSGWCWQWQNTTGLTYMALHHACLAVWALSGILLALSQVAFVVIAVRRNRKDIVLWASAILFVIAVFVFLLSLMPS